MKKLNKTLLGGSIILLITFNLFNLLNLVYNLVMVRLLSLEDYGTLTSLIYVIIIFAVFSESIQTVVSKYTTMESNSGKVKNIIVKSIKKGTIFSIILFIIYLFLALLISPILRINYSLLALTGIAIFTSFLVPVTRGALQGKKKFSSLGFNMIAEGSIKLGISVLLVLLGLRVYGAILGAILGSISAFALSFISLNDIIKEKEVDGETPKIYSYTRPVFVITSSIILFISLDILLAKRFFSAEIVGAYAISSTIAKILFIGTQPISKAMFPISTESKKIDSKKVLFKSLAILSTILIFSLIVIYYFSSFIINIYSGRIIEDSVKILFYLSLAMSLLSVTNLILLYKLSLGIARNSWIILLPVLLEVALLSYFSQNLMSFSIALVVASVIFLMGSLLLIRK